MPSANMGVPNGRAAAEWLKERYGLEWGDDIYDISEDGVSFEGTDGENGLVKIELVGRCTRADAVEFTSRAWSNPSKETNDG